MSHSPSDPADTSTPTAGLPLPPPFTTADGAPYWAGLQTGELRVQRCSGCGALRHYPRPMCPACHSFDHDWAALSGRGTVHSWTVLHQSGLDSLRLPMPLALLTVDMAEGVRMLGLLVDALGLPVPSAEGLAPGLPVQARVAVGATGVLQPVFQKL